MAGYSQIIDRANATPLIPEERHPEIIQNVVTKSAVLSMARRLPNMSRAQLRMKVLDALPKAYFVNGDTGLKQTTNQAWANKFIDAEEIAVIVPIPINVLADAEHDVFAEVRPRIEEAMAQKIDRAILTNGDADAPVSWPDDLLTQIAAASHSVDLSTIEAGGDDLYDALLGESGVMAKVEADGFGVTGNVAVMQMKAKLRGLRDSNGQPIFKRTPTDGQNVQSPTNYDLDGNPIFFLDNGAVSASTALLFTGDWRQMVYAMRMDMSFKVFDAGVLNDASGQITHNLIQQDMVALRAVMRMGWQVPNPVSIMNETEATRFPFAALVP